jgi:hypothetical protein
VLASSQRFCSPSCSVLEPAAQTAAPAATDLGAAILDSLKLLMVEHGAAKTVIVKGSPDL